MSQVSFEGESLFLKNLTYSYISDRLAETGMSIHGGHPRNEIFWLRSATFQVLDSGALIFLLLMIVWTHAAITEGGSLTPLPQFLQALCSP